MARKKVNPDAEKNETPLVEEYAVPETGQMDSGQPASDEEAVCAEMSPQEAAVTREALQEGETPTEHPGDAAVLPLNLDTELTGPEGTLPGEEGGQPASMVDTPTADAAAPIQLGEDEVFLPGDDNDLSREESGQAYAVDLSATPESVPVLPQPTTEEDDWGFHEEIQTPEPPPKDLEPAPDPPKSERQQFYDLKFNELDRDLTQEERQEWNSIYASYRGRSALSGVIVGVDPLSIFVRQPRTGQMVKQTMYCAIVVPYRVRVVIPGSEMWEKGQERPDYVFKNMVGSTIDFIITKVDRISNFAIGSRRLASRSQRYFFAHREDLHRIGARVKCRTLAVGPRRCLVECYGHDIDMTQREMRYASIPDLRLEYHPGMEIDCIVKVFDADKDDLVISVKETEVNPFVGAEERHPVGARRLAVISGKYGGGVFCNLPDGVVCMCNYSYQHEDADFMVGENVILVIQRYENSKLQIYGKIMSKW